MGAIDTSYIFTATDVITSTKMNNILDQSVIDPTAVFNNTLDVASGKLLVKAGGITSNELAANAVTTTAILDANVTTAKIADLNVTTAKIADSNVTTAKILDANVTASKLNGAQTGAPPIYGVRAWGRFDGTGSSPISPIYVGNIASVTRTSTGVFVVLFTTPMTDANYSVVVSGNNPIQTNNQAYSTALLSSITVNGFTISFAATSANPSIVCFQVIS
jgi:hypothetical protein